MGVPLGKKNKITLNKPRTPKNHMVGPKKINQITHNISYIKYLHVDPITPNLKNLNRGWFARRSKIPHYPFTNDFPLHPILPPIQGETPSYVWLVGFKPVSYSYIPPINPNVNQVINQLSYNSAANPMNQWIGLRENLQENTIFDGKFHGFL